VAGGWYKQLINGSNSFQPRPGGPGYCPCFYLPLSGLPNIPYYIIFCSKETVS
jgi:hypothetical protein